jgi:uracil-DNA glycosylase family 4
MSESKEKKDRDVLEDVKAMLEFYEALGIEGIPVTLGEPSRGRWAAPCAVNIEGPGTTAGEGTEDADRPKYSRDEKIALLKEVRETIGDCTRCRLSGNRKNIVFGEGDPDAKIMFIGEAPGKEEDIQGLPFVGDAGILLTKLIEKMGLHRSGVYIGNIIKCRPPMNRDPEADEIATCRQFIERQIGIIRPAVIVTLGRIALQTFTDNPKIKITAARGKFFYFMDIPVMPTFHPAYLLRNPGDKWKTWADAQKVLERIGISGS